MGVKVEVKMGVKVEVKLGHCFAVDYCPARSA